MRASRPDIYFANGKGRLRAAFFFVLFESLVATRIIAVELGKRLDRVLKRGRPHEVTFCVTEYDFFQITVGQELAFSYA